MKYIDADKLIAEIERLTSQKKTELEKFSDEDYTCSIASSINCKLSGNLEALSIIKSLQQEQPEVDLDAEIDKFLYGAEFKRDCDGVHVHGACIRDWKGKKYVNRDVTPNDMRNFARHFAEWGAIHLNARKEESK